MEPEEQVRARLLRDLATNEAALADLARDHAGVVAASREANADDEHDPEGATIAFERQQLVALTEQARATRAGLLRALALLDDGGYGVCAGCGAPIGEERLQA
ncbi:MAG: DNA-binding protein, partial [Frankiales bacterium]|nr:DNA-binding protein [Frankiales bacterium]